MVASVKKSGMLLLTVLVRTAVASQAATAAEFHSTASSSTLKGVGTSNHVLDIAGIGMTCTGAEFTGAQTDFTASAVTMNAKYTGCSVSILGFKIGAVLQMNGCAYDFNANGTFAL